MSGKDVAKIIRFKKETPDDVIDQTVEEIKKLGGNVQERFKLVKAIKCTMPANIITTFDANEHVEEIEDDSIVTTQ